MRIVVVAILLSFLALPASARPPTEDELPSLASLVKRLEREVREAEEAARAAARDPDRDFLRDYRMALKGGSDDHRRIVEIMDNRAFDTDKPGIRELAATILKERWSQERKNTLKPRREVSRQLIRLLSNRRDAKANRLAIDVLRAFWQQDKGYKIDSSWREKNKAIRAWREFLK
jgi:hypothetical protein